MRNDAPCDKHLPVRVMCLVAALALVLISLPKSADAKVYASKEELELAWTDLVFPEVFKALNALYTNADEAFQSTGGPTPGTFWSPEEVQKFKSLRGTTTPAKFYSGLLKYADNAGELESLIVNRGDAAALKMVKLHILQQRLACKSYGEVADKITNQLVPLLKKRLTLKYDANPAYDFSDDEIGSILNDETIVWTTFAGGGAYTASPHQLMLGLIGDKFWTNDPGGYGHPCTQAWLSAVVASRPPKVPADPLLEYDNWQNPGEFLNFPISILPALCKEKGLGDDCHVRARYTDDIGDVGPGGANIVVVIKKLDALIKALEDSIKPAVDAAKAAADAKAAAAAKAAALIADVKGRGSVLSLPLPLSDKSIEDILGGILKALLGIVGAIALLMFVWGGFQYMIGSGSMSGSGPDAKKINAAKQTITWAALGLVAIFSSYAVLNLVIKTFTQS